MKKSAQPATQSPPFVSVPSVPMHFLTEAKEENKGKSFYPMASIHPPELTCYSKKQMRRALFVAIIPAIAGAWALYRQEMGTKNDVLQSALTWAFCLGIAFFLFTMIYQSMFALPKCPTCHGKMKKVDTISITKRTQSNKKTTSRWRIVHCLRCNERYRIPGFTED